MYSKRYLDMTKWKIRDMLACKTLHGKIYHIDE
jgi:hypothetical protein